jgi:hypothetical protein
MVMDETRLTNRSAASASEHEDISAGFRLFRDLPSEQGHDPSLELYHAAAT